MDYLGSDRPQAHKKILLHKQQYQALYKTTSNWVEPFQGGLSSLNASWHR
ncbi:hypothetical protein T05_10352 [Trichinella murrelli]|uniref:Uncharacterized protein n=1 Tax=Trichinella murrelli TaxID=144512 RepID=A0A0V0SWS0_9BILA|nr:hypothetical protein T05_10352 [Trichinella murrelli]